MTSELVITAAGLARMAAPEVNLAAWGIVFALSVIIQAPAQTLLPSATALASDAAAYARLRRYALRLLVTLSALQVVVAATPAYFLVMRVIGAPGEVVDVARLGLLFMAPYAFGTGFRRFQQGVLIRYGDAKVVVVGSIIRLVCVAAVLTVLALTGIVPGVVAAGAAVVTGVLAEAGYTQLRVVPILAGPLRSQPRGPEMTLARFLNFVWPLVLMTVLTMLVQTFVSVALARLPLALESLAVWPVVWGFLMLWQSPAMAYTEVVISLIRRPGATAVLVRLTLTAAVGVTALLALVALTPLARVWFGVISGLDEALTSLAVTALLCGLLLPGIRVLLSWYQGVIMYSERTRAIMESVLVFLAVGSSGLLAGAALRTVPGVYVGIVAFTLAFAVQTAWLGWRSRPLLGRLASRGAIIDAAEA